MPSVPHDDRDLQKIAILSIPDAVRMLEGISPDSERHRLAGWLARFWHGGVYDLQSARECVATAALDEQTKQTLTRGLMD